jgi:hypothetical protein
MHADSKNTGFQLPDSMIVFATLRINHFSFGKFSATESSGQIIYQPKVLKINDLTMKSQKGQIFSDIEIQQKRDRLVTLCVANFQKVDIGDVFYAFNNFGQQVILDKNLDGSLSGTASLKASWDFHLSLFQNELELKSAITIENGELIEYQPLLGLSKFIEVEELSRIKFDKLQTNVIIQDRVIYIPETRIISSAVSLIGSGEHDFENHYRYKMQVQLSDILWNKAKKKKPENTEFGDVVDDGLGKTTIPLVIEGKDTDFEVYYDKEQGNETFRAKVQAEKEEFKRLIHKDEIGTKEQEQNIRLEWEEENDGRNSGRKESRSDSVESNDQDFVIEWDDN